MARLDCWVASCYFSIAAAIPFAAIPAAARGLWLRRARFRYNFPFGEMSPLAGHFATTEKFSGCSAGQLLPCAQLKSALTCRAPRFNMALCAILIAACAPGIPRSAAATASPMTRSVIPYLDTLGISLERDSFRKGFKKCRFWSFFGFFWVGYCKKSPFAVY